MRCSSWRCFGGDAAARAASVGPQAVETGLKLTGDLQEETHNLQEWSNLQLEIRLYEGGIQETIRCSTHHRQFQMGVIPSVMDETPQLQEYLTPEIALSEETRFPRSTAHKHLSTCLCPRHPTSLVEGQKVKCSTFLATLSSQVHKRVKRHLLWHEPKDSKVVFANSTADWGRKPLSGHGADLSKLGNACPG